MSSPSILSTIEINHGIRGLEFKSFVYEILNTSISSKHYLETLLSGESIAVYSKAFTSSTCDPDNNYEMYEQLGDSIIGSFIVWYMYRRFPHLKCAGGVKVVARLKIKYGSRDVLSSIAQRLSFWKFVTASVDEKGRRMKDLLEDVFEGFIGASVLIIDEKIKQGVGYAIIYDVLSHIFDRMEISLRHEDLYDSITRLKEIFDMFRHNIGCVKKDFKVVTSVNEEKQQVVVTIYRVIESRQIEIGTGTASKKADAEQRASEQAISNLHRQGYVRPVKDAYLYKYVDACRAI